mmetsp:Transcript_6665/g.15843  ORF Transcript_6665/g.15843 Transcript_6665/m.15843 type:complete len:205 (-) Transcript_6665:36-650(-)
MWSKSTGGEHVRMWGLRPAAAEAFRCGMQCFATSRGALVVISHIKSKRLRSMSSVGTGKMAEAQFTTMSMPPNSSTALSTAALIEDSSLTSTGQARARPPQVSTSWAAEWIVPGRVLCASTVLAQITMFAPSFAHLFAIARPMPRDAPVISTVFPLREPPPPNVEAAGFHFESAAMRWGAISRGEAQTCALSTCTRQDIALLRQ